jgi:hypothetical protein
MKITDKTLMLNFENVVTLGNSDAIELKLIHQAFISRDKLGKIDIDIELMDVMNIKFLGIAVETSYSKFREQMLEFGIDVYKLVNKKAEEWEGESTKTLLKLMFREQI